MMLFLIYGHALPGLSSMLQNVFILNTQRGQSSKLLFSIWEFCRSLEQSFPFRVRSYTQPHHRARTCTEASPCERSCITLILLQGHCNMTRLDFVLISLLQGNDYLPKLRGASLDRCVRLHRPSFSGDY